MSNNLIFNTGLYAEFYSIVYISTLVLGILIFSCTSSYKQVDLIYLSDINYLIRFKSILFMMFFFFCLISGIPPFISFTAKFLILYLVNDTLSLAFILFNIITLLVFYLSIFKHLKIKANYKKKSVQVISFNCVYISLVFFFFNISSPFTMHIFIVDLI